MTSLTPDSAQFGYANIPFGVVSTSQNPTPRCATRLFDKVYQLPALIETRILACDHEVRQALSQSTLNDFASLGRLRHREVREALQVGLRKLNDEQPELVAQVAISLKDVVYHVPVTVGDFSDFSCSRDHVLNAGEAVFGKRELPPGFLHFPVGYGGRSSSIMAPYTAIRRPLGQFRTPDGVQFGATRALDFELELACVIGKPSQQGEPVRIQESDEHIFGFLLLNDWSARDIQGLEMNPLGPFNGKSFGTSISPWIVTVDALAPFKVPAVKKDIELASYLQGKDPNPHYAIRLGVEIEADSLQHVVCESRADWLYWTVSEMIAHQTINGCPLNSGDLLVTGTISGNATGSHGCLLEATKGGKQPLQLQNGTTRSYLQDGDAVRFTGVAGDDGSSSFVGFGECYGKVLPNIFAS